jgi:hypothetical protein
MSGGRKRKLQEDEDEEDEDSLSGFERALLEELAEEEEVGDKGESSYLEQLPHDCLLKIVSRLTPDALCCLSQTSRRMEEAASDSRVWEALYHVRWPLGVGQDALEEEEVGNRDMGNGRAWKRLYLDRDGLEMKRAKEGSSEAGGPMSQLYMQMTEAFRAQSLTALQADATLTQLNKGMCVPGSLSDHVSRFMESHGGGRAGKRLCGPGGSKHGQGAVCKEDGGCEFVQLMENYWICKHACGAIHLCGEACDERQVSAGSEMMICRLTGRCFTDMVAEGDDSSGVPRLGHHGEDREEEEGGRLGRAFLAGFYAADSNEMRRRFGVSLDA